MRSLRSGLVRGTRVPRRFRRTARRSRLRRARRGAVRPVALAIVHTSAIVLSRGRRRATVAAVGVRAGKVVIARRGPGNIVGGRSCSGRGVHAVVGGSHPTRRRRTRNVVSCASRIRWRSSVGDFVVAPAADRPAFCAAPTLPEVPRDASVLNPWFAAGALLACATAVSLLPNLAGPAGGRALVTTLRPAVDAGTPLVRGVCPPRTDDRVGLMLAALRGCALPSAEAGTAPPTLLTAAPEVKAARDAEVTPFLIPRRCYGCCQNCCGSSCS